MRKAYSHASLRTMSPLALLCAAVFAFSALLFAYLFFYQDFQKGYRSLKARREPLVPVFIQPEIRLPQISVSNTELEDLAAKEAQKIFIAYELGEERLASKLAANFLADRPESPLRHRVRLVGAHIRNKNGDTQGALEYLKKILSEGGLSNEDFTDSVLLMGAIARETKQYDSYLQTYLEQAYFRASEPVKSKLAFYLGYLLLNKKDYTSASKYFNQVIGEDGVLGRAAVYAAEEKRPETINSLAEFLDQYPASTNYGYVKNSFLKESRMQAASFAARGYTDAALSALQKIIARFPQSREGDSAFLEIADLYESKLEPAKMKSALEKILDNEDEAYDSDALFRLGKLAFTQNQYPEALGYFRVLTEKFPASPYIKETLEWQRLILDTLRE